MGEQKAFLPSRRKIEKARLDGTVLKSPMITQSSVIAGGLIGFLSGLRYFLVTGKMLLEWPDIAQDMEVRAVVSAWIGPLFGITILSLVGAAALGLLSEILQVGLRASPQVLAPRSERLDLFKGFVRIAQSIRTVWFDIVRYSAFAIGAYFVASRLMEPTIWFLQSDVSPLKVLSLFQSRLAPIWLVAGLVCSLDYFSRRHRYLRDLSMSHDELRRESKDDEGDPHVRGRRRSLHEELMWEEITEKIKTSRVIIVARE